MTQITRHKLEVGPQTPDEIAIFIEEAFRVNLQAQVNGRRLELGLSFEDLAHKAGVTPQEVDRFFSDDCDVSLRTAAKLLIALKSVDKPYSLFLV
jgi:hypothetical protein